MVLKNRGGDVEFRIQKREEKYEFLFNVRRTIISKFIFVHCSFDVLSYKLSYCNPILTICEVQ